MLKEISKPLRENIVRIFEKEIRMLNLLDKSKKILLQRVNEDFFSLFNLLDFYEEGHIEPDK